MPNEILNEESYPIVFSGIDKSDVNLNSFSAHKKWTITSGSSTSSLLPLMAVYTDKHTLPALGTNLTYNDASNIDGSLQSLTYFSIDHLFYKRKNEPFNSFGNTDLSRIHKFLYQSASILSLPSIRVGLQIKPTSTEITASGIAPYDYKLKSDKHGNLYDTRLSTSSIIDGVLYYEGFNEYFDTSRIKSEYQNITFISGVNANDGLQQSLGFAAHFNGAAYMKSNLDHVFTRDIDYAISFLISSSAQLGSDKLILGKLSQNDSQFPFKIELSGSNCIKYTAQASSNITTTITSSVLSTGWNHIICQKTGSIMQLYVNTTLICTSSNPAFVNDSSIFTPAGLINNTSSLYIGGFNTTSSNLIADLDEVRIFNKGLGTSSIRSLNARSETGSLLQTNVVGNVFHEHGIVVISSPNYIYNNLVNTPFTASYRSTVKRTEFSTLIKVPAGQYNMSLNTSQLEDDLVTYKSEVTGSSYSPYITTIGLYNDYGCLMAVAKLAQPIKKRNDIDMNFLIRIDLDQDIK